MARPQKQGIDYFPFDVDFFEDEKIEAISGEFGIKGEITVIRLLCAIYRNGYFVLWSDIQRMRLLKKLPGVSSELLDRIVNRLVRWDFFDKDLFHSARVLTSSGIQKRYFSAVQRRKFGDSLPFLIGSNECDRDTARKNGVNVYNNSSQEELMYAKTPQSKVKESKVNENEYPPTPPGGGVCVFPFDENSPVMVRVHEVIPDPKVREAFREFVRVRYDNGHTISETSVARHLKRLIEISTDPQKQLDLIDLAIVKNWKTIFPEPPPHATGPPKTKQARDFKKEDYKVDPNYDPKAIKF